MFKRAFGRKLGWLAASVLTALFALTTSPAWALDLESSIGAKDADTAQIMGTLGRAHTQAHRSAASKPSKHIVHLVLLKRPKAKHRKHV